MAVLVVSEQVLPVLFGREQHLGVAALAVRVSQGLATVDVEPGSEGGERFQVTGNRVTHQIQETPQDSLPGHVLGLRDYLLVNQSD